MGDFRVRIGHELTPEDMARLSEKHLGKPPTMLRGGRISAIDLDGVGPGEPSIRITVPVPPEAMNQIADAWVQKREVIVTVVAALSETGDDKR